MVPGTVQILLHIRERNCLPLVEQTSHEKEITQIGSAKFKKNSYLNICASVKAAVLLKKTGIRRLTKRFLTHVMMGNDP